MPIFQKRAIATLVAALLPLSVMAAGSAVLQFDGDTTNLSWQDNRTVRIDTPGEDNSFMLIRDGKAYVVQTEDGAPQVMEIGDMMRNLSGQDKSEVFEEKIESVKATGKKETVAGIAGEVYQFTVIDKDGKSKTTEAVLTNDPLVVEMTQAYLGFSEALAGSKGTSEIRKAFPAGKQGLLRSGDDMKLQSISSAAPAADAFKLPAEPVNMNDMMKQMMDQIQQAR